MDHSKYEKYGRYYNGDKENLNNYFVQISIIYGILCFRNYGRPHYDRTLGKYSREDLIKEGATVKRTLSLLKFLQENLKKYNRF